MRKILCAFLVLSLLPVVAYGADYRAWHVGDEVMGDVTGVTWNGGKLITTAVYTDVPAANFVVMRYTPLSDKDSTPIVEGDFIEYVGWIFEVEHNGQGWRLRKAGTTNYFQASTLKDDADQVEVIGNAYQNPGIENTRKVFEMLAKIKDIWKDLTPTQKQTVGAAIAAIETVLEEYYEEQE